MDKYGKAMTAELTESSAAEGRYAAPTTTTERLLSEVLADIMGVERVSVDSHFFDDLGADSMVMARFCARIRKRANLPLVSMKKVYEHPTISGLAAALTNAAPAPVPESVPASTEVTTSASASQYVLCGMLQFLSLLGYVYLITLVLVRGYDWISGGSGFIDIYVRSVLVGGTVFFGMCILPILVKWMLIGRWKPQQIRIWSLEYFRFWVVKTLVRLNPLVLFVGSPIYVLYLRALGTKIGRDVVILSHHVPVCTDLLTIGDNTVIRKDSFFTCYRAHAGLIQTGPVTLGRDAYVGEWTVLDIETSLGDGAQLGHSSSLHAGQFLPVGEHRCGSPAQQRTVVDYRGVGPAKCGTLRKVAYSILQLLTLLGLLLPLGIGIPTLLASWRTPAAVLQGSGSVPFLNWTFYSDALVASFVLFFGVVVVGLVFVCTFPRLLNLAIKPGKVYPLYSFHYWVHGAIARLTNVSFFNYLFGDSSYIVHYLYCLGYDISFAEQTGANFGLDVKHETPYHVTVGPGMMAADGLSIINVDYSNTSFRVSPATIGSHSFFGNYIAYPSQGKTGENCLHATKVMVPIEGEVREDVGFLGSPSFEIPRLVFRDRKFDDMKSGDELGRRLAAKNKHNVVTMGLYLLTHWVFLFGIIVLAYGVSDLYPQLGVLGIVAGAMLALLFGFFYYVLVERAAAGFQALRSRYCSIYEPEFWPIERYWKLSWQPFFLDGTPFKGLAWRLLGVRIGKRVFDDGCLIMDKTMVTIGDGCVLNAGSIIQPHSQEDGIFKSDRITIGVGCTLGVRALVHYGVTMGDGATLDSDAFLMKGSEVPPHTHWRENPAREVRDDHAAEAAMTTATPPWQAAGKTAAPVNGGQDQ